MKPAVIRGLIAADRQAGRQQTADRKDAGTQSFVCCSPEWAEQQRNRKDSMRRAEEQRSQGQTVLGPLTGRLELTVSTSDACLFPPAPPAVAASWARRSGPAHSSPP